MVTAQQEQIGKHLEFIQAAIARLAGNSFTYKGWAITLVSAAFAVLQQKDISHNVLLAGIIPSFGFWVLDAQALRRERLFRCLYDEVRKRQVTDFSMNTSPYEMQTAWTISIMFSASIFWLYVPLTTMLIGVWFAKDKGLI